MNHLMLVVNGVPTNAADVYDDLSRAVLISLFTWRRANPDDELPGAQRFGWWGDSYADISSDRIGSRLWLLCRAKLTSETVAKAREYAVEALQWLVDDGAAAAVDVVSERAGLQQLSLGVTVTRGDGSALNIRFANVWSTINVV